MSSSTPGQMVSATDFKSILDALTEYKKKTGKELLDHPLAVEVQRCDSVDAILAIFHGQAKAFRQFRDGDQRLMKWIGPLVDVLFTFSAILSEGVALASFPPAKVIFLGIGVLLTAAKGVRTSHDVLVELFERIESFSRSLGAYTQISLTTEMVEVFVKILTEVLSILSIATKEVKRKRAKIYFRKLLGRTDIEDAFRRLDSLIQEEVRMALAQTNGLEGDAKKANDNIDEIKWNKIEQDVRKWFSPPDPSINHNTVCDVYHNVPPTWFFEASVFKDWMSNGSLLWIHGKPGSGKSILCSAIIQYVITLRDAGRATLAYFYFDFQGDEKQNVRDVVASLLVQLSAYSKPCCDIIYRLYLAHGKGAQQPSNGILINRLKEMLIVAGKHPIFVIMDALDECPSDGMPTPREAVLNFVMDLVRLQIPNLHICATSRQEITIQTKLKPIAVSTISLDDETRQRMVISNYVSSVVSSDERMMKWRDEDKKLVVEELSERADGMFQWVFCQLEMLRHAVQSDVREILEKLPKTLDETYERVLKGIDENNREPARRLLHCLAVSVRPLRVEELAEILTFGFDSAQGGIPKFYADRRPKDQEEAVLSICSSLVTVVNNRGSRVVQFSHPSVKEFLTSDHLASSTGHLTPYHILPGLAHTMLAQVCLGFLLHLEDADDNNGVKGSPLAEYAARHWVTHAQFEGVASRVEDGMKALFDLDKPHFATWIGLYDIDAEPGGKSLEDIPTPLYYSALCGFHDLVQHLAIVHPQHVNAFGGSYAFPLVAALCRNHVPVAELLLEHGGSVDVRDMRKQTALHKTIDRHDKVAIGPVQFLLERGADVNARRDDLWTPLHLAVNTGELLVAQMLLDHRADVNLQNGDGQTPLHLLSRREPSKDEDHIAKLLLERDANVNEKDKHNATPLHLASYNKRLETVRALLSHGAIADAENDQGENPLQIVLRGNRNTQEDGVGIQVVRLLLEYGAEAYARDKYRISTSDLVCCSGKEIGQAFGDGNFFKPRNKTAFWLWVEECNVNGSVQDMYDTILLHSASYHGRLEMAQMLSDCGVKSNAENHWGETALHVISRGRYESQDGVRVAKLFLERGVDVNAQDKDHNSPLHSASYNGNLEIARVLLECGAEVSAKNDRGSTPLHYVSQGEYESQANGIVIAQLLLDRGVDVNTRDGNGETPLCLASWCGKLEIVRLFLEQSTLKNDRDRTLLHVGPEEHTVDSNVQQKDHETALHIACFRGKPEIARLLLDHGTKVNVKNDQGEIPLHLVSRGEYSSPSDGVRVAELLLERGTDVNAQDKADWTPLHFASYCGKSKITQALIHHGAKVDAENESNLTPLHVASFNGKLEVALLLLNHGAKVDAVDEFGNTPLCNVSRGIYDSEEAGVGVARLLLERGGDANGKSKQQRTPLHFASYNGKLEIVRLLLDHGAKVDSVDSYGNTPLHDVSQGKYDSEEAGVSVVRLLLERGGDMNGKSKQQYTPLHFASYNGKLEIVRLLLDHDAKADAVDKYGNTPLHDVSQGKHDSEEAGVGVAWLLLERGGDVNGQNKQQCTPLHLASFNGRLEIARILLDHDAKVDAVDEFGNTPLCNISRGKYDSEETGVGVVRLLLERGGDVNKKSKQQYTPLHFASYIGKLEIVRLLLDNGAKVDAMDEFGKTPLHDVSQGEYDSEEAGVGVARLLLERGGDVNGQNKQQCTPLHLASFNGRLEIARILLDHDAKVDAVDEFGNTPLCNVSRGKYDSEEAGAGVVRLLLERGGDVNEKSKQQYTPLHFASYIGKLEIVRLLLDHGAKVDAVDEFGKTPLHDVSQGEYDSEEAGAGVARLLLEHGGDANAQSKQHWQRTPLHFASFNGKLEIARLLLDHGARADAVDELGNTPLHDVSKGKYEPEVAVGVARLLLERGSDVNAQPKYWQQRTPLHIASYNGKLEIVRLLLDQGAQVDALSDFGGTALHYASGGKYESEEAGVSVVQLLLERGGDVNGQSKQQWTPLHFASFNGKLEIARLLLDRGAKVDAVDEFGETPLCYVPKGKYDSEETGVDVTRLLLEHGADVNPKTRSGMTPLDLVPDRRPMLAQFLRKQVRKHGRARVRFFTGTSSPATAGSDTVYLPTIPSGPPGFVPYYR